MNKLSSERIRTMLARSCHHSGGTTLLFAGRLSRGCKYSYYLEQDGSIWRNYNILEDRGLTEWEKVATPEMTISALSGPEIAKKCKRASTNSLFQSGGTLSSFDIYSRDYRVQIV